MRKNRLPRRDSAVIRYRLQRQTGPIRCDIFRRRKELQRSNMVKRRQRESARPRGAKAGSKTASRRQAAATDAIQQPGVVPVVMAVAASATGITVDSSQPTLATTPKNLLDLRFNDARVGLKTAAQLENWRRNLSQLLPQVPGVETLSVTPSTVIGDAVTQVSQMLAAAQPAAAPIVMAMGVVEEARKKVADRWGREFATKSSAAL